jgi:hypothetical protein
MATINAESFRRVTGPIGDLLDAWDELWAAKDALTRARAKYDQALAVVVEMDAEAERADQHVERA